MGRKLARDPERGQREQGQAGMGRFRRLISEKAKFMEMTVRDGSVALLI